MHLFASPSPAGSNHDFHVISSPLIVSPAAV